MRYVRTKDKRIFKVEPCYPLPDRKLDHYRVLNDKEDIYAPSEIISVDDVIKEADSIADLISKADLFCIKIKSKDKGKVYESMQIFADGLEAYKSRISTMDRVYNCNNERGKKHARYFFEVYILKEINNNNQWLTFVTIAKAVVKDIKKQEVWELPQY